MWSQMMMSSHVLSPSKDTKQNGEANVVLSDEEQQPLSTSHEEEKQPMRRSSTRDKNKKAATCFLLSAGDFSCAADGGIRKGMHETQRHVLVDGGEVADEGNTVYL